MEKILFIGRFEPFHLGHLSVAEKISENTNQQLIIGIGTPNSQYLDDKNPFTFIERKQFISQSLSSRGLEAEIVGIPDFNNNYLWRKYVEANIDFDRVISGNKLVNSIFSEKILQISERYQQVSATIVRKLIQEDKDFASLLPTKVIDYIYENGLYDRLLDIKKGVKLINPEYEFWELKKECFITKQNLDFYSNNPLLAVDAVIVQNGKVLLIERKNPPYGWALPGGFVDKGEDLKTAVLRELKEELNLDGKIEKQVGIYDDPTRDIRGHTISVAFKIETSGKAQAGDDAKSYKWVKIEDIKDGKIKLAFDHKQIVLDALK